MHVVYSLFSVILSMCILLVGVVLGSFWCKDVAVKIMTELSVYNNLYFYLILFVFSVALLVIFGIMLLFIKSKMKYYLSSSLIASGISMLLFSLFFRNFNIIKNFYFISTEFSNEVKMSLEYFFMTNIILGSIILVLGIIMLYKNFKQTLAKRDK